MEILVEAYEEVKEQTERYDDTPTVRKQREITWQSPGVPPERASGAQIHTRCSAQTIAITLDPEGSVVVVKFSDKVVV